MPFIHASAYDGVRPDKSTISRACQDLRNTRYGKRTESHSLAAGVAPRLDLENLIQASPEVLHPVCLNGLEHIH